MNNYLMLIFNTEPVLNELLKNVITVFYSPFYYNFGIPNINLTTKKLYL